MCACVYQLIEDEGEKFDRLQRQILQEQPESMAFYSAKMKLLRRVGTVHSTNFFTVITFDSHNSIHL
jgi:hypothetical protein